MKSPAKSFQDLPAWEKTHQLEQLEEVIELLAAYSKSILTPDS
jgi:hypothetical protein